MSKEVTPEREIEVHKARAFDGTTVFLPTEPIQLSRATPFCLHPGEKGWTWVLRVLSESDVT